MKKILCLLCLIGFVSGSQAASVEVGFSPEGTGAALVLKVIESSRSTIRVAAYSFTSYPIVKALIAARKRGVDVEVVADAKENTGYEHGAGRSALSMLVNNHISVRLCHSYPIHHDKYIVVDGRTVETGSFNYSKAASESNSENVIVIWDEPNTAALYLQHWKSRYDASSDFEVNY